MNFQVSTTGLLVLKQLEKNGHDARFAGGCVRDYYMGTEPKDWDIATTATPEEIKGIFQKTIDTGLKHGTVTVVVDNKQFEITTLRRDVLTDGRHAKVEFTKDWLADASRRDFTMNAMYMDRSKNIYDYFNGKADIDDRRVRFVGDPTNRIREDALRILRYFRFLGKFKNPTVDALTLAKITEDANLLTIISGERRWSEFKQIMYSDSAWLVIGLMEITNVSPYVAGPFDVMALKSVMNITEYPIWRALLAVKNKGHFINSMRSTFKASNVEIDEAKAFMFVNGEEADDRVNKLYAIMKEIHRTGRRMDYNEVLRIRSVIDPSYEPAYQFLIAFGMFTWPINGDDLIKEGFVENKELGEELDRRRFEWFKSYVNNTVGPV